MNEQNIQNYFERVKQNPPVLSKEKVHQLISSPKAQARLKGKTFKPFNLFLMTTLTVFITSAILLWPGSNEPTEIARNSESTQVEPQTLQPKTSENAIIYESNTNNETQENEKNDEISPASKEKSLKDTENVKAAETIPLATNKISNRALSPRSNTITPVEHSRKSTWRWTCVRSW